MISQDKLDNIFIRLFTGFSDNTSISSDEALLDSISTIFCLNREKLSEAFLRESSPTLYCEELNELVWIIIQIRQLSSIKKVINTQEMNSCIGDCKNLLGLFQSRCAFLGASEDIKNNSRLGDNSLYFENSNLMFLLYTLEHCAYLNNDDIFNNALYCFCYEMFSRLLELYFFNAIRLIKNNNTIFEEHISHAAGVIYNDLFFILKNAHIVDLKINSLSLNKCIQSCERNKTDNTTRLLIGYGYDNNDYYSLRLDFSHKGVNYTHLNFKSPKGIETPCFTNRELKDIKEHCCIANIEQFFIEYDSRFYLKEEHEEIKGIVNSYLKKKYKHKKVLSEVDEQSVLDLFDVLQKIMPFCTVEIKYDSDKDESMLRFDRVMGLLFNKVFLDKICLFDNVEEVRNLKRQLEKNIQERADILWNTDGNFDISQLSFTDISDLFADSAVAKYKNYFMV